MFVCFVLGLAAFNLTWRLDREMVDVWDESLYATSALEQLEHGRWIDVTFDGVTDYLNAKPPLNVWLIASSFRAFGVSLVSLRLPAVASAWLTVAVMVVWASRRWGLTAGALTGLVLSTTYGFLYVHSGRTANADATLTLAVTVAAIAVWEAVGRPWRAVWLGPAAAVAFLLKGPGALVYLAPLVAADVWLGARAIDRAWIAARLAALGLALAPIATWTFARWRFDGWRFLETMLGFDTLARATQPLQEHDGSWLFYLDVLQRHQFDWVIGCLVVIALAPHVAADSLHSLNRAASSSRVVAAAWAGATVGVPTLVATKLAWYLNPFYPLFALGVALTCRRAWAFLVGEGQRARARVVVAVVALAAVVAEARLYFRSTRMVDVDRSAQGLLLTHAPAVQGRRVFAAQCPTPERFLARAAGGRCIVAATAEVFMRNSAAGDLWLDRREVESVPGTTRLGVNRRASLHRRQ